MSYSTKRSDSVGKGRQKSEGKVVWKNPSRRKRKKPQHFAVKRAKPAKLDLKLAAICFSITAILFTAAFSVQVMADSPASHARETGKGIDAPNLRSYDKFLEPSPVGLSQNNETEIAEFVEVVRTEAEKNSSSQDDLLSEREMAIIDYLCSAEEDGGGGLTKAGVAAVMGCMYHESGLSPTALNSVDGGYGIIQWTDVGESYRKQSLYDYCDEHDLDADSIDGQLKYFVWELQEIYSEKSGYPYPVYETLTTSDSLPDCLYMFFCHNVAGTNVVLSYTNIYAGHTSTQALYDARMSTANYYYDRIVALYSD